MLPLSAFLLPLPGFTYAEIAHSSGDLYQIQMVKNNLLNTFLDKLKPKAFLSPVQPYLKGQAGEKVRFFPSSIPESDPVCQSSDVTSLAVPSKAE